MPCIDLPELPQIDVSFLLPDLGLSLTVPSVGLSLCCKIETPPIPLPQVALGSLGITNLAGILIPALALINSVVDQLNDLLDQVQVDCPLQ